MAKVRVVQTSFTAGELSDTALGRTDLQLYFNGAKRIRNCYVMPQGGLFRREGLGYVAEMTSSAAGRNIPFVFSTEQEYLISFTAGEFKVYKDNVLQATVTSSPIDTITLDQINAMKYTQSQDVLTLFFGTRKPIEISRTSDTSWTVAEVTFDYIPKYAFSDVTQNSQASTLTLTAQSEADRYTAVAGSGTPFSAASVGQQILANFGVFEIVAYTNSTTVTIRTLVPPTATTGITSWVLETGYEDVWSNTRGWPAGGCYFLGRLFLYGGERVATLFGSRIGEFYDFELRQQSSDDALEATIDSDQVNAIQNLIPGRSLQIYTSGGEFYVGDPGANTGLTPDNFIILRATELGSEDVRPVGVDGSTYFIEKGGSVIREFVFNELEQSYISRNVSRLSSHLVLDPSRMAARPVTSKYPCPVVFMVNSDGTVTVFATNRNEKFEAFFLFSTDGIVEDVATLGQRAYFIVRRSIDGNTVRYIEELDPDRYLDCSAIDTNSPADTDWTGFGHLAGETVAVRGDGYNLPDAEVDGSGEFSTEDAFEEIEAGFAFYALVQTLPIEYEINGMPSVGEYKRLISLNVRLYDTRNLVYTRTANNGVAQESKPAFRAFGSDVLDQRPQLFNGWKRLFINGVNRDCSVILTQSEPTEWNITSLVYEVSA